MPWRNFFRGFVESSDARPERKPSSRSGPTKSSDESASSTGQKAVKFKSFDFAPYDRGSGVSTMATSNPSVPRDVVSTDSVQADRAESWRDSSHAESSAINQSYQSYASSTSVSDASLKLDLKARRAMSTRDKPLPIGNLKGFGRMSHVAEGTNGVVYLARRESHGDLVALKQPKVNSREATEALRREYELLKRLNHDNVVTAKDFIYVDSVPILVMGFVPGKSLDETSVRVGRGLNEEVGSFAASGLCNAVNYIAKLGIVHRDIMPRNVLVVSSQREKPSVVLVDFGSACQPLESVMLSKHGAASYCSPEMKEGLVYGLPVDVWGVGATLAAAMYGCGFDELFDLDKIAVVDVNTMQFSGSGWLIKLRGSLPSLVADFLEAACTVSPKQRPTIGDLLDHPFLTGYAKRQANEIIA